MTVVVVDTNFLIPLLDKQVEAAQYADASITTEGVIARVEYFVEVHERQESRIVIPAPVMAEVLQRAGNAGPEYVDIIERSSCMSVVPFDLREAIELAVLGQDARERGDKRWPLDESRAMAKVNFDRQIIATAITHRAELIVSDDADIHRLGEAATKVEVRRIADLPLPPEVAQHTLALNEPQMSPLEGVENPSTRPYVLASPPAAEARTDSVPAIEDNGQASPARPPPDQAGT